MTVQTAQIPLATLEKWRNSLELELADVPGPELRYHHAFSVSEELYDVIIEASKKPQQEEVKKPENNVLGFNDIEVGRIYTIINIVGQKYSHLNGLKAKVVKKNRTRVVVELLQGNSYFNIADRFKVSPASLRLE